MLRKYTLVCLRQGQQALEADDAVVALQHFERAMQQPEDLAEAYHLLQPKADVSHWIGKALRAIGSEAVK